MGAFGLIVNTNLNETVGSNDPPDNSRSHHCAW